MLDSGWFIQGQQLIDFENEYAAYCGGKHCVGVGNGLDALHLILRAYGIGEGDEVIVPSTRILRRLPPPLQVRRRSLSSLIRRLITSIHV